MTTAFKERSKSSPWRKVGCAPWEAGIFSGTTPAASTTFNPVRLPNVWFSASLNERTETKATYQLNPSVRLTIEWPEGEPDWCRPIVRNLAEILALPEGWNSYGAKPVNLYAAVDAIGVLSTIMPLDGPLPQVVPTSPGGVQLEWHKGGVDLEIVIKPSNPIHVSFEDQRNKASWEGDLGADRSQLKNILQELARR